MNLARRAIVARLAGLLAVAPAAAFAQSPPQSGSKRIAVCLSRSDAPDPVGPARTTWAALFAKHGLVDGKDIEIGIHRPKGATWGDRDPERDALARQIVAGRPAVILVVGPWLHFIRRATSEVPIVALDMIDPEHGGIESHRRPGGNVTGVDARHLEMLAKRLELLKELRPESRRLAHLGAHGPNEDRLGELVKSVARRLGMESERILLRPAEPAESVARALRTARIDIADFAWSSTDRGLMDKLVEIRVAASFPRSAAVRAGGLLSFDAIGLAEIAASLAVRILRGEGPASIPTQQPTEFHMAINRGTARSLGITVPPSILVRANEVVD